MSQCRTYRLDIGCGQKKREGFLGVDYTAYDGVDFVVDMETQKIPVPDNSVSQIYSSHFLEHLKDPVNVLVESARVAEDNALFELWTPYASCNSTLFYLHDRFYTEEIWRQHFILYERFCGVRWQLRTIHFIIPEDVVSVMSTQGVSLDFALRFYRNIATEFKIEARIKKDLDLKPTIPTITYATDRDDVPKPLPEFQKWFRQLFPKELLIDLVLSEGKAFESNKRVYVWGTGAFSKKVAEWFRKNGLEVSGYFDGERQDDEKLVPRMIPNAQVVIGAMCQDEIVPQVHALGYSDNEIICFY